MVAVLVSIASCNKEAGNKLAADDGAAIEATFEVSSADVVTKAAISDGSKVDKLFFFLYDKGGKLLFNTDTDQTSNAYPVEMTELAAQSWSVKVRLIKGMTYKVAFWAQKKMDDTVNPFSFDTDGEALTVDYAKMTMNSDNWDAFWAAKTVEVTGPVTEVVKLYRPFAQLNVGAPAADYQVVSYTLGKYGKEASAITSQYTIKGTVPNTMNLLSGEVSGNAADATTGLILNAAAQPNATLTSGGADYQHLAMAYILVNGKITNNVELTLDTQETAIGTDGILTRSILNVPLQRNYRTNILGSIFSVEEEFKVEVESGFVTGTTPNPDYNVEYVSVASMSELTDALDDNKANTEAMTYQVTNVEEDATNPGSSTIVIPDNTKAEALVFQLTNIDPAVSAIVITDETTSGNEEVQYGNDITVEIPVGFDLNNITVYAPYSHVTVKQGDITTLVASTSSGTLVVAAGTNIETLTVKCGNVKIEKGATVGSIVRDAENPDAKTLVYIEDFASWVNINAERNEIIVPVVNGEDEILPADYVVSTAKQLENAIKVAGVHKVYVSPGSYDFTDYGAGATCASRYSNSDVTIIGIGEVVFNSPKYGLVLGSTEAGHEVTLKHLTINAAWTPVYVKDHMTVNLNDLQCNVTGSGKTAILMDNHNKINGVHVGGTIATVNAHNITVSEGGIVEMMAKPSSYSISEGCGYEMITYCYFNYDGNCNFADIKAQDSSYLCYSTGSNLFVNGEPLPPYTEAGQLAIKDENGDWQIVTGYKYDNSKSEVENGAALIEAIRASKSEIDAEGDPTPFYIGTGTYMLRDDNSRLGGGPTIGGSGKWDIRGAGDVIIKGDPTGGFSYGLNFNGPDPYVVNAKLSNVTVEGGKRCPIYCRGNVTVELNNVTLRKGAYTGDNAINIDAGSDPVDKLTATVTCKGVSIEEGLKIEFIACPWNYTGYDVATTYINFSCDDACNFPVDVYRVDSRNLGNGNITVNSVAIN